MSKEFLTAYVGCALWTTTDEKGKDLVKGQGQLHAEDVVCEFRKRITDELWKRFENDCNSFIEQAGDLINDENCKNSMSRAGHDFWLTRNGHGAGFSDGHWTDHAATKLTELSDTFGEQTLYVGDNGMIDS